MVEWSNVYVENHVLSLSNEAEKTAGGSSRIAWVDDDDSLCVFEVIRDVVVSTGAVLFEENYHF